MDATQHAHWLEQRRKCITGTDIASIVGLNPYKSAMGVFMDKVSLAEPTPENEAMRWGKALEPLVAARYATDNNVTLRQGEFTVVDEIFGGTPDYLAENGKLIEIKTTGAFNAKNWGEPGTDQVPDHYLCQVQWYLMLCGRDLAELPVLIGGNDYRVYKIVRNQNMIDLLRDSASDFWHRHVIPQEPPKLDGTTSTKEYLESFFPRSRGKMITAPIETDAIARHLAHVKTQLADIEKLKTELENKIKFAIGDNDGVNGDHWKATWKSTDDSMKIDYEKLVADLKIESETLEKYAIKRNGVRRFVFTMERQ